MVAQMPLAVLMDFAAEHGVPPLQYSLEDTEVQRRSTDRLKA